MKIKNLKPSGIGEMNTMPVVGHETEVENKEEVQKAEVQEKVSDIDELYEKILAETLLVKDILQRIEGSGHEINRNQKDVADLMHKLTQSYEELNVVVEKMKRVEIPMVIPDTCANTWNDMFKNHFLAYIDVQKDHLDCLNVFYHNMKIEFNKANDDFLEKNKRTIATLEERYKKALNDHAEREKRQFEAYRLELSRTLSRGGIWFTEKVFYWVFGTALTSFVFTVLMLVLIFLGHVQIR